MTLRPPYALFVTAEDVDVSYLNDCLSRCWKGNDKAGWQLWLATDKYEDAPKTRDDNKLPDATSPPVDKKFKSPWAGKDLEEAAKWLLNKPDDVAVDEDHFNALDEFSKEDDTVLICRYVKDKGSGKYELEYFPEPTDTSLMTRTTAMGLKFDEMLLNYQRSRQSDGKPDRSRGGSEHQ